MKKAALFLILLLVSAGPAWCYRFDCSRSCTSSCGSDLLCQIQCHTCCPVSAVRSQYLCGACRGLWQGDRCMAPGGAGPTPSLEMEAPAPSPTAPPHGPGEGGYEDVDVM